MRTCSALARKLRATLGRAWPTLAAEERNRRLKLPRGGDEVARTVARLTRRTGYREPADAIVAHRETAQRMRALAAELAPLLAYVEDVAMQAESECWSLATQHYMILQLYARKNPRLDRDLEPVREFFRAQRRGKRE